MGKYILELSQNQAEALSRACELYARLGLGQFHKLEELTGGKVLSQAAEDAVRSDIFPKLPKGQSYSIRSKEVSEECRILWDTHQVLRHRLAWDNIEDTGGEVMGVTFNAPLRTSDKEELALIKKK